MQFSPAFFYFFLVRSKHFPQHPILEHPQPVSFPLCETIKYWRTKHADTQHSTFKSTSATKLIYKARTGINTTIMGALRW